MKAGDTTNDMLKDKPNRTSKEREERPKKQRHLNIQGSLDDVLRAAMNAKPKEGEVKAD